MRRPCSRRLLAPECWSMIWATPSVFRALDRNDARARTDSHPDPGFLQWCAGSNTSDRHMDQSGWTVVSGGAAWGLDSRLQGDTYISPTTRTERGSRAAAGCGWSPTAEGSGNSRSAWQRRWYSRPGLAPEPARQCGHQEGKHHAHGYAFRKPNSLIGRAHLVLGEQRADDGDQRDRGPDQSTPPGQRIWLSEPPNSAEHIGVEKIVRPDALRQQGQRQGGQRQQAIDIARCGLQVWAGAKHDETCQYAQSEHEANVRAL